ncbi:Retrotransposon protein, Ty3-gypsy subclass [Phytophthora megakarya]|uniref:Retrotransposon protein, Ty3-gypsy subclass n=1 Tax=Phytophthora megakarya TaxID=4795 RepID=A0A225VD52_9STRA|nr:Retrotransposon protein, Ty3-gypsy subclass [Phytophthora megakarya]
MDWHSRFRIHRDWISDPGTHFKNEVMEELCTSLKSKQIFSSMYRPWINRYVERVNEYILKVLRVLIIDYKINHRDWPRLVPVVHASLHRTAVPSLSGNTPGELFTRLELSDHCKPYTSGLRWPQVCSRREPQPRLKRAWLGYVQV